MWERKLVITGDLMKAKNLGLIFAAEKKVNSTTSGSGDWVADESVSSCTSCSRSFDW